MNNQKIELCQCGCGERLEKKHSTKRYLNHTHHMRHWRKEQAKKLQALKQLQQIPIMPTPKNGLTFPQPVPPAPKPIATQPTQPLDPLPKPVTRSESPQNHNRVTRTAGQPKPPSFRDRAIDGLLNFLFYNWKIYMPIGFTIFVAIVIAWVR